MGLERWMRDLLDSARLEVGAGVYVQREHVRVSLLISVRLLPPETIMISKEQGA